MRDNKDSEVKAQEERVAKLYRAEASKALRNTIIANIVIVILWTMATYFLPSGWWIVVINILCLLGTLLIGWFSLQALKIFIPSWLSILISGVLWLLLIIGGRTLLINLLDALVGG
ncbi:hypothetical protein ACFLU4_02675 [Chloroflexota bacterium]